MSNHRGLLVAVTAPALLAAVAVGVLVGLRHDPGPAGREGAVAPAVGTTTHDALAGSSLPRGGSRSGTSTPSPAPSAAPSADPGVERMPEVSGAPASGLPGLGAAPASQPAARGRVVSGYPAGLLPPAPGSTVLTSSTSPSPGRLQVALVGQVGRQTGGRSAVLRFYRTHLARAGFVEHLARPVGGARAASFARGGSSVLVTVQGATYSVYATLHTAQG